MGLFTTKKKIVVGTVATRVIKDDDLPNAVKTGLLKAVLNDDGIPENVMEELVGSVGMKAERMYTYASTTYAHGLPSGQVLSAMEGVAEVTAVLETQEGGPVLLTYSHYSPPNLQHIGWSKLIADHGYDPATNQLAALSLAEGFTVYLNDMTVVVPEDEFPEYEAGALEQWGTPATAGYTPLRRYNTLIGELRAPTPVRVDPLATSTHILVDYIWAGPPNVYVDSVFQAEPQIFTGSFQIPVTGYDEAADYFHAKYTVGGVTKYWMYLTGSGTHPTLDGVFTQAPAVGGTFFPFAYFRYNKTSEIEDKTTQAYITSKKLVKYLGMDYDTVASAIDENPDIDDVEQAMLVMAVPANTEVEIERRYLFTFFDNLFTTDANQFASPVRAGIAGYQGAGVDISKSSLVIQDARFKMALSNSGIYKQRVAGSIGAVGTHSSAVETLEVTEQYTQVRETGDTLETHIIPIAVHVYRRQISHALYDEIKVVNLKMMYHIIDGYAVTAEDEQDILLIPLDRSITTDYSIPERELLYSRSLHFVFNSVLVIKVKWYQQFWFQFVMYLVATVVTILSLGSAGGAMAAAIAGGSISAIAAAAWALLLKLLEGLIVGALFKLFVKAVGGELALVLAVVVALYAGFQVLEAGSIAGAPWAQQLLQLSSGLAHGVSADIQDAMGDLLSEYASFNLFKDEATKQLEAANKLLEHKNWLSPFVIFGETPNDYFNRTVHSGNIGLLSISAISSYVDIALTLPKLDETIGGSAYAA